MRKQQGSWAATALGAMWLALFPFWQDGSFSRITHSKWVGMLVLTGVTAVAAVRCMASSVSLRRGWRAHLPQFAALAYFLLVALSAVFGTWADYLNESLQLTVVWGAGRYEGLVTQLCYAAVFLCMSLAPARLEHVITFAGDGLLVFCAVTALQYAGVNVLGLFPAGRSIRTNYEFQGTIGNIDMVSGYVSLVMPALLCGFLLADRNRWNWLLSGLAGVLLMLVMEVQSGLIVVAAMLFLLLLPALMRPALRWRLALVLAGVLALLSVRLLLALPWLDQTQEILFPHAFRLWKLLPLVMGAALAAAALLLRRRPGPPLSPHLTALTALVLIAAVLLALLFAPLPQGSGLWEMQELLRGRPQDAFGSERIGIWRLTLEMSRQNLLFGTGPDTFLYAMEDYMFQTDQSLVQRFDNPHNMLLAILSNNGLPALLAFIALCGVTLVQAVRRGWKGGLTLSLVLGALCYLAQGMFTFSICLVTPMFWAVLGMLAAQSADGCAPTVEGEVQ